MKFFSYDPEDGFDLHKTKQEAMDRARACMAEHQDMAADDGWHEGINEVCWGEVRQAAVEFNRREDKSGRFDYLCDWRLCSL